MCVECGVCVIFGFKDAIFVVKVLLSKWVLLFVLKNIIYKNHPNEHLTYSVLEVTASQLSLFLVVLKDIQAHLSE